ncbi:MAG TPA: FtsX-like permease family protein [Gemmataceae bacterium]|jgi:lipoprotein-releasing system permease protein|nr:FtsX-like permease family protein [Gemmataceae bacterium]
MYKFLLCWRYLLTRYLALACIISVMLGVATLIVVNSVMSGFSTKLKSRLHDTLSDITMESFHQDGMADPERQMERIRNLPIGKDVLGMSPTIEVLGMVQMSYHGEMMAPRAVRIIGVDVKTRTQIGGFAQYLTDPRNREKPQFEPRPDVLAKHDERYPPLPELPSLISLPPVGSAPNPEFPPAELDKTPPIAGAFVGWSICNIRKPGVTAGSEHKDMELVRKGDEIILFTASGQRLTPVYNSVIVSDFFKSEMSEYDANYIFVPIEWLQRLRATPNRCSAIQITLRDYSKAQAVLDMLRSEFRPEAGYQVSTWEEKQGPLLAAISIEKGILNVLLFMIVGVAGFGILSIFAMIVVEKTRDIGILKALGASNVGVMNIFLGYGLLLGVSGSCLGTIMGLLLTRNINEVEHFLTLISGHELFNRSVYYFDSIPTDIQAWTVCLVNVGAVIIAVVFSVIPALRAALLNPVRALRYE